MSMDCFSTSSSFHVQHLLVSSNLSKNHFSLLPKSPSFSPSPTSNPRISKLSLVKSASSKSNPHFLETTIKSIAAGAVVVSAAAASLLSGRRSLALAELPQSPATVESSVTGANGEEESDFKTNNEDHSPLSHLIESNPEAVDALRALLYEKLEEGDDSEGLVILQRLMAAQPTEAEWKFMAARLLNEMGQTAESRILLDDILAADPLSFEALFENAVLMDRCGEGSAAVERLERALEFARTEQKKAAAHDVRLILAQIHFLQRNVEAALSIYDELAKEDPKDYRPYFCQGVIYTLLDRDKEAREKFAKYNELSQKKGEVNAYLQTPLSRIKLFGTGDSEIDDNGSQSVQS